MRKTLIATALLTFSAASQAWWGPGWGNGLGDGIGDGFADGAFNFNMSGSARSNVHGRGYGYDAPYDGYGPYYGYAPYAPHPQYGAPAWNDEQAKAQKEAFDAQQKAAADYHKQMEEQRQAMQNAYEQDMQSRNAMWQNRYGQLR
jgi:hypothetical protein